MTPRLAYLVTEDWYFLQHRLPMARAAKAAGYEVHVLTRVDQGRAAIEREGFVVHPLWWRRRSVSPVAAMRATAEVRRILKAIQPQVLHNIAMKPAVIGSVASLGIAGLGVANSITGLGSVFLGTTAKGRALRPVLKASLGHLLNRANSRAIVQNPDDRDALINIGVAPERIDLIPGSGVDTDVLTPLPEPLGLIRAGFVARMLEDKGIRALIEAHRMLRARSETIELVLAGDPDPENPTSIPQAEIEAWAREPGITWLGHVTDIRPVWEQCQIAVLPSRREGLPKALLEAAACGRPMVATDAPGCREVCVTGVTGILVPVDDAAAIAAALSRLARSPDLRARMGAEARRMAVERFSSGLIGRQTVAVYTALSRR